jgi:Cu-Zn family superoxide dismutase
MRIRALAVGAAFLLGGCATAREAVARYFDVPLTDAAGRNVGTVRVEPHANGTRVVLNATGLPAGAHGAHLHAVGRCEAPAFTTAGPHWNPTGRQHGTQNPAGPHRGDLPNLTVTSGGTGSMEVVVNAPFSGAESVFDADGTAFVVHAAADDNVTDPSGNSGARIACAVVAAPRQ